MVHPWNMQPGESSRAYEAFEVYRNMPPKCLTLGVVPGRSIDRAAAELGKPVSLLWRWSARHRWVERVRAFDAEAARLACERLRE